MGSKSFKTIFSYFFSQVNFEKISYFFEERGVKETKWRDDKCEKESRER